MTSLVDKPFYDSHGYVIARQLFSPQEVAFYVDHYMALRSKGRYPGDFEGVEPTSDDPLRRYPRMIHMHRWDAVSLQWMIDKRLNSCMTALLGREPYAVQTMLYFKPPQARGQALHQDQYYLRVQPGTCMAAWMALDRCDEANGCLLVVPGSQTWPVLCTTKADTAESFTDVTVPIPADSEVRPIIMDPGDTLFFNGQLIHGSLRNSTADRFRRAIIGHYIDGAADQVARFYHPVLCMDGSEVQLHDSQDGTQCGVWVDRDGNPSIEMTSTSSARVRESE